LSRNIQDPIAFIKKVTLIEYRYILSIGGVNVLLRLFHIVMTY